MGLKTLQIEGYNGPSCLNIANEKEDTFHNFVDSKSGMGKLMWKSVEFLIKRIGYMPYVYFEKEDVDEDAVKKLIKYPQLLKAVTEWVESANHKVMPDFHEAKRIFEKIHKPVQRDSKLYRGFSITSDQYNLGLNKEALAQMHLGKKFEYDVNKLLSFSSYHEVTKAYGNVIVTVDYAKEDKRMFHITNEILIASFMVQDGTDKIDDVFVAERQFSYFESVFLPDGNPLEFTLLKK